MVLGPEVFRFCHPQQTVHQVCVTILCQDVELEASPGPDVLALGPPNYHCSGLGFSLASTGHDFDVSVYKCVWLAGANLEVSQKVGRGLLDLSIWICVEGLSLFHAGLNFRSSRGEVRVLIL